MRRCTKPSEIRKRKKQVRASVGVYMVETLVALVLGAMFAYALFNMFAETMRLTSSSGNRLTAELISQTVLDSVKRTDPAIWQIGSYPILVNSQNPGERDLTGAHPLPVGLNAGELTWSSKALFNKFRGNVSLEIQSGASAGAKAAVVTVVWADGENYTSKSIGTLTMSHPKGVNFWP